MLAIAGCAGPASDRIFAGTPTVTAGSCPELISQGSTARSILHLHGAAAQLTLGEGVVELQGQVDAAGHVNASRISAGADHKPFTMVFDGQIAEGTVTGAFATPRCRAQLKLSPS